MNVIETNHLGRRYRRTWALRDCTLIIPGGHIVALVGPNGAGKTTLLTIAVGLTRPTRGTVTVLGGEPAGSPDALDRIAFVAQDAPLYRNLRVAELSGGQKAQLALTIALARRPSLLVLDEPLASLDPVAREDFLASVVEAAADGISVVLSSHVLAELERVATYLIVLARGEVRVAGAVKELLGSHGAGLEQIAIRHLRADVPSASRTE